MSGYVWYSFGSDKTGPALGEALGFDFGKKTPNPANYEVVVGWGCKAGTKYDEPQWSARIGSGQLRVLNHPRAVAQNRDKLWALKKLCEAGVSVPGLLGLPTNFTPASGARAIESSLSRGAIQFPLVAYNNYHRGEPVYCYTIEDVVATLRGCPEREHPLSYFRTLDHGDEFRVHVFRDTALFAQKKQLAEDPVGAATDSLIKKLGRRRAKEGQSEMAAAEKALAREVVQGLASEILRNASHLKKSSSLGWRFVPWGLTTVPPSITALAAEALDALDLDMGAVSISYADEVARVLSVTTAPALSPDIPEEMGAYVEEIRSFSGASEVLGKRPAAAKKKDPKASSEVVARIHRRVRELSAEKALKVLEFVEE
jgi:hypothetical protein